MKPLRTLSPSAHRKIRRMRGFTLPEILVAITIFSMVAAGATLFMRDFLNLSFDSARRLEISRDIRLLTERMASDARGGNSFKIFSSFDLGDRDADVKALLDGASGDFAVFIFTERWSALSGYSVDGEPHVTRLIGYFRLPDPDTKEGPVFRFDRRYHPPGSPVSGSAGEYQLASTVNAVESMLTSLQVANCQEVVQISRGLADGTLFHNYRGRSVMVQAQIVHGTRVRRVTETYNFTVSPRG